MIANPVFKSFFLLLLQKEALLFPLGLQLGRGQGRGLEDESEASQRQRLRRKFQGQRAAVGPLADCRAWEAPGGG